MLSVNTIVKWNSLQDFYTGKNVYSVISWPLKILIATACFELAHAIIRIVPSSPAVVLPQVAIRFMVVWGVTDYFEQVVYSYFVRILILSVQN